MQLVGQTVWKQVSEPGGLQISRKLYRERERERERERGGGGVESETINLERDRLPETLSTTEHLKFHLKKNPDSD